MKGAKIVFVLAALALIGALTFGILFFFAPEAGEVPEDMGVEENMTQPVSEEELLLQEAEAEIQRFKDIYGLEIGMEEMYEQVKVRKDYEKKYGSSYDLEDVFLAEIPEDDSVGDPGNEEYEEVIEKIQEYVRVYNIDESRYASMTAEEELAALEVEYGPLPDETVEDDKQNVQGTGGEGSADTTEEPTDYQDAPVEEGIQSGEGQNEMTQEDALQDTSPEDYQEAVNEDAQEVAE